MDSQPVFTPLEKIALSCSGGGYRAAAFHLGSLWYLNRLTFLQKSLLERVEFLSTVSGGTITGVIYALYARQGKSFEECYAFLMDRLRKIDLVAGGIEYLNPDVKWQTPTKRKNLINAFAEQYDDLLTKGALMGSLESSDNSHLHTVVFNSTEFSYGLNFRFRNQLTGYDSFAGNDYYHIPKELLKEIKLSDVMAASSCFPGGFEPIVWPADFEHAASPEISKCRKEAEENKKKPIGIMDGGIYDNQGIDSILNYRKSNKTPYFDLVIISDVASPYMEAYKPFEESPKQGWNKLTVKEFIDKVHKINRRVTILLCTLFVFFAALPICWRYSNTVFTGAFVVLAVISVSLLVLKGLLLKKIYLKADKALEWVKEQLGSFYFEKLRNLKIESLSLHRLQPLIADRLSSLRSLLMNVFLKVVRRLNYDRLYEDDRYAYRRVANRIKELTKKDYEANKRRQEKKGIDANRSANTIFKGDYKSVVAEPMSRVAEEAASFGTTLWFTDQENLDDKLSKLVATGQFTMCYNMIDYLEKLLYEDKSGFKGLPEATKAEIHRLYQQCLQDWKLFGDAPTQWV